MDVRALGVLAALLSSLLALSGSASAETYPSRTVRLIVPFAAGGPTDVISRIVTGHMAQKLGQSIIVENVVNRIDEVVRGVRFDGWQSTIRGDQEVRQALRKTLYVQFKIRDNDVYEKALGYVREYY